ncbi:MAG: PBP1A family penicillin-binding protein [Oscillospiraceae bacterium]|nr:PBP1A family penicillin-binding protein [Oscillospiraceae bacterium]
MNKKPLKNVKKDTDWGNEVAHSVGLVGKVFRKIFSYIINILLTLLLVGLLTGAIVGGVFALYIRNYITADLEGFEFLATNQNETTKIYYMDFTDRTNRQGKRVLLEDEIIYGSENRTWASYREIPKNLTEAFIAIEDKRFDTHGGVDWVRTISATLNWVLGGSDRFGASTITQQLIKNITQDDDISIQRKVQEILRALELEKTKDKSEIMELYLNTIFLSQRSYGVQAAAQTYFGKDVKDLTLIECAAIAAIPQAPTKFDPIQNPENNAERRNKVLIEMHNQGKITRQEFDSAYKKELKLNLKVDDESNTSGITINSWYKDQVIEESIRLLMEKLGITREIASRMIYNNGLQIITVMDPKVQKILEEVFEDESNFRVKSTIIKPESAMVVIDPATGDILGLVGGMGEKTSNRLYNYATQGRRPPGSAIKPLSVYAPALDAGLINYASVFDDVPVNFGTFDGVEWSRKDGWPSNLPKRYDGLTTLSQAIKVSKNTIAVRVLTLLGVNKSFDFMKNKLNIGIIEREEVAGKILSDIDLAPLGLGELTHGVTVEEMTRAYAIFCNRGIYNDSRTVLRIEDSNGNVIVDNNKPGVTVISEATANIMTKLLQTVVEDRGTASRIELKNNIDVAGKTGTTNSDNDRWFIGYTPYYVGGVWFGYSQPRSLENFQPSPAVLVWDKVMQKLHEQIIVDDLNEVTPKNTFQTDSKLVKAEYCIDSGKIPTNACRADPRRNRVEIGYFTTGPNEQCDVHIMVNIDAENGGGIDLNGNCPKTVQRGLIKVNRNFPYNILITDAQYTYMDLDGREPNLDPNTPFYLPVLRGNFSGTTGGLEQQYNRVCTIHYNDKPSVPEPEPPPPQEPPPDTSGSDPAGEETINIEE